MGLDHIVPVLAMHTMTQVGHTATTVIIEKRINTAVTVTVRETNPASTSEVQFVLQKRSRVICLVHMSTRTYLSHVSRLV